MGGSVEEEEGIVSKVATVGSRSSAGSDRDVCWRQIIAVLLESSR